MRTLKVIRVESGLTIVEASKKLGITPNTLSRYERGETFPNVKMLKKIEELYKVPSADIFFNV